MPSKGRGLSTIAHPGGIAPNSVELSDCSWYSHSSGDIGALKLPRGVTTERPTVHTGGRENFTFDLTVSQPDVLETDPGFPVNDPWLWSWEANYNRANPATNVNGMGSEVQGLTLLKGSTYTFRNFTVGHKLWLRHTPKTNAGDPETVNQVDGVTNNGAIRPQGASDPGVVTWTIPTDYAYGSVYIQHSQTGMVNEVTVADPPTETLGYIRLNTDPGSVRLETYTGTGWRTLPYSDEAGGVDEHPTGTLTLEDNGTVTDSVASTDDAGAITGSATVDDFGALKLLAFLDDGKLSILNDALVIHDGATPGGIQMLKADQSNTPDTLVNKRFSVYRCNSQTLTDTLTVGANTARVSFNNELVNGISGITFENSFKTIRMTKDVPANNPPLYKFDFKFKPNQVCTLELWKNGSRIANADYTAMANYHNHFMWIETGAFNDTFEFRIKSSTSSVTINSSDILTVEFLGS